jgi:hypothetical protein
MKSFKEYLTESKKVYEFKVKIAGECPKDCTSTIKAALSQFHVESCSSGKTTPIQERQSEFPEHKNVSMTIFDVCVNYPATNKQLLDRIAEALGIPHSSVRVRNLKEEEEYALNHKFDQKSGKAVLGTDFETSNNQNLVGEEQKMNFLKAIGNNKRDLTPVTGTNDQLFVTTKKVKEQTEQSPKTDKSGFTSPVGTKQNKLGPYANSVKNSLNVLAKGK